MSPAHPDPVAYFEGQAEGYGRAGESGLWAWQRRREATAVFSLAGEIIGRSLLDLGCGAGYYARWFAALGAAPVVAVDAAPAMLAAIGDARVTTHQGDAANIRLERRFDRVIAAGILEFVPDAGAVLANIRRHLESGGRAVILLPPDTFAGRLYRLYHRRHGLAIHLYHPAEVRTLAAGASLMVRDHRSVPPYADVYALEAA